MIPPTVFPRDSEIRLLNVIPAEAGEIESMAEEIWPSAYGDIIPRAQIEYMLRWMYSPSKLIAEMTQEGIRYFWITSDTTKAGFIATGPSREETIHQLHKFYILPGKQGHGIGSRAMDLLIASLVEAGATRLELRVNRQNTKAIAFYRKNNFEAYATDCRDIGNGFVMDDFLMRRLVPKDPVARISDQTIR